MIDVLIVVLNKYYKKTTSFKTILLLFQPNKLKFLLDIHLQKKLTKLRVRLLLVEQMLNHY